MPIITTSQLKKKGEFRSLSEGKRIFSGSANPKTVFLSHKHSDINKVRWVANILHELSANVYIDWLDETMPNHTNRETAKKIKNKIIQSDKFVLVATDEAINSKWCNWELGFGDSTKHQNDDIALFGISDNTYWAGSEYMQLYPVIQYSYGNGDISLVNGDYLIEGFFVIYPPKNDGSSSWMTLEDWLNK